MDSLLGSKFFERLCKKLQIIGRPVTEIQIVIVSKGRTLEEMTSAMETAESFGFRALFGESYISELKSKILHFPPHMFHFIGRCHSNMIKTLIKLGVFVQSVSSLSQLAIIAENNLKCFLQVNISEDARKAGFDLSTALEVRERFSGNITGVMTILAADLTRQARLEQFKRLRNTFPDLKLSAGMSDDWEEAIEAGSDILRIGRLIFQR